MQKGVEPLALIVVERTAHRVVPDVAPIVIEARLNRVGLGAAENLAGDEARVRVGDARLEEDKLAVMFPNDADMRQVPERNAERD
jgi:hypothetical protein